MSLKDGTLSEINQAQKDKYCTISLICEILKNHKSRVEWWLPGGWDGGSEGRGNGKSVVKRYKFSIILEINCATW
jgi:hypothetical protein